MLPKLRLQMAQGVEVGGIDVSASATIKTSSGEGIVAAAVILLLHSRLRQDPSGRHV